MVLNHEWLTNRYQPRLEPRDNYVPLDDPDESPGNEDTFDSKSVCETPGQKTASTEEKTPIDEDSQTPEGQSGTS
ncbi:hypothetical protein PG995_012156 [Apiospora arundinis]